MDKEGKMKTQIVIHLISEASSLTLRNIVQLVFQQFADFEQKFYFWDLINNDHKLEQAMGNISEKSDVIFYHITDKGLEDKLQQRCKKLNLTAISVTNDLVAKLEKILGTKPKRGGKLEKLDDVYFNKVENIDFSIKHDDGQNISTISQADIILVGLSRSSKTPTSMYLAFNGLKVANIPFIDEESLERYLLHMRSNLVIGLLINPSRLMHIRESRMPSLGHDTNEYVDLTIIREECRNLKELCQKHNWPMIDVTAKSVEETASSAMKIYYEQTHKLGDNTRGSS